MSAYTASSGTFVPVDGIRFRLARPLLWRIGRKDGPLVTVEAGFIFDVSIPRSLRWLFDPLDRRFLKAAALHDWLLQHEWNRVTAGAIFHEALTADGVPAWRRIVMLLAVQLYKYR